MARLTDDPGQGARFNACCDAFERAVERRVLGRLGARVCLAGENEQRVRHCPFCGAAVARWAARQARGGKQ